MSKALSIVEQLRAKLDSGDLGRSTMAGAREERQAIIKHDKEGHAQFTWDAATQELTEKVKAKASFSVRLANGIKLLDIERYRSALLTDINEGPSGARSRSGALQSDLARLVFDQEGT